VLLVLPVVQGLVRVRQIPRVNPKLAADDFLGENFGFVGAREPTWGFPKVQKLKKNK
jgi:hypothetical protein